MEQPQISQRSLDAGGQLAFSGMDPNLREMIGTAILSRSMHREGIGMLQSILNRGNPGLDEFATRAQVGAQYGLQPGSEAHREYTLTGRLPQPKAPESPFSKIDPKDYTQESLKRFRSSGDPTDLVPRETPAPERDQFVGAPFGGPAGETLVRDKQGMLYTLTDRGPLPYQAQAPAVGGAQQPSAGAYGGATPIQQPPKPLTEAEGKNTAFYGRMQLGEQQINRFFEKNPDYLESARAQFDQFAREAGENAGKALGGVGGAVGGFLGGGAGAAAGPLGVLGGATTGATMGAGVGYGLGELLGPTLERWLTSDAGKAYQASAAPFVNAALRKDTGAQINNQEWTYAFKEWLPMPGDSAEVQAIKAQNRTAALEGARAGAGAGVKFPAAPQTTGSILRSIQQEPRQPQRGATGGW